MSFSEFVENFKPIPNKLIRKVLSDYKKDINPKAYSKLKRNDLLKMLYDLDGKLINIAVNEKNDGTFQLKLSGVTTGRAEGITKARKKPAPKPKPKPKPEPSKNKVSFNETLKTFDKLDKQFKKYMKDGLNKIMLDKYKKDVEEYDKLEIDGSDIQQQQLKRNKKTLKKNYNKLSKIFKKPAPKPKPEPKNPAEKTEQYKKIINSLKPLDPKNIKKKEIDKIFFPNEPKKGIFNNNNEFINNKENLKYIEKNRFILKEDRSLKYGVRYDLLYIDNNGKFKEVTILHNKPKEEDGFTIEELNDLYDKKKLDEPVPFSCDKVYEVALLGTIMNRHKNDCVVIDGGVPLSLLIELGRKMTIRPSFRNFSQDQNFLTDYTKYLFNKKKDDIPDKNDKDNVAFKIAERFLNCKKRNKSVVIPLAFQNKRVGHMNMLFLNHIRNELEHFEPHGDAFRGSIGGKTFNEKMKKNIELIAENINKYLPEKEHLKTIHPNDTCPLGYTQYQGLEAEDEKTGQQFKEKEFGDYSVKIKQDTGYCCVWSFMYMDFRQTKNMINKPTSEVMSKLQEFNKIKDRAYTKTGAYTLKKYVRGLVNDAYIILIKTMKSLEKKGDVTMDENIKKLREIVDEKGVTVNLLYDQKLFDALHNILIKSIKN